MFTLKDFHLIYKVLTTIGTSIGTNVYVYLEDTNEIINIQQRHWDRSEENTLFAHEIVKAVLPKGLGKIEKEFVISLWTSAMKTIGIE